MKKQKLSDRVILFTDDRRYYENVVVIWTDDGPVIVDAFRIPEQFAFVQRYLEENGFRKPILQVFTHWHSDHTLGNQQLNAVPILAHARTEEYLEKTLSLAVLKRLIPRKIVPEGTRVFVPTQIFEQELTLNVGNTQMQFLHAPGHTTDSIMVWLPESQLLIAGDNLVGAEVEFAFPPVLPDDDATDLQALAHVYRQIRRFTPKGLVPGHGWVLPPDEMLALNEHRYRVVLKRTTEMMQRGLQGVTSIASSASFDEHMIRAWLSQAKSCNNVREQEALKENMSKVLRLFSEAFDRIVLHED